MSSDLDRLRTYTDALKRDYDELDFLRTTLRFALSEEGGTQGWRPPKGVHPLVDTALDLREEVERLRAQRALDNDELARAYDMGRDNERAATVAHLLAGTADCAECMDEAVVRLAREVERGDHRKEKP